MEIKNIKEISNIGTFSNFIHGGHLGFEKLTFIYGGNTFGKTTLTDVFQSLKYDNPDLLKSRKTIPSQTGDQKVTLKIKVNKYETTLKYDNELWIIEDSQINADDRECIKKNFQENLEVFGSEFIHKNLFTGYTIERENKENFTDFILGEEGVALASVIQTNRKLLGEKVKELKNYVPRFIQGKSETEQKSFLDFQITGLDKGEIDSKLQKYKSDLQEEEKRGKEPQKILGIEDLENIVVSDYTIIENITNLNTLFEKAFTEIKDEFLKKFNEHIAGNFLHTENAESWIKEGYENINDKTGNCIFCGQSLVGAKDIIDLYNVYFDENYSKFILEVEEKMANELDIIEKINFDLLTIIQKRYTIALKYKEFISDADFQQYLENFEGIVKEMNESELNESKVSLLASLRNQVGEKNKKPYKEIGTIDFSEFNGKFKDYLANISQIVGIVDFLIIQAKELKTKYKDTAKIIESITALKQKIQKGEFLIARIEQDENCTKYLSEKLEIETLSSKIEEDSKNLRTEQNQYLEKYFKSINDLFDNFGSHNFTLGKDEDNKGHKPVYSLKVKFHGKEINGSQLQTVFSESDRRALALAIFWTKITLKEEHKKKNTIVILDDPITSFDNERTKVFIDYLNANYKSISQLIILTHYSKFLSDYYLFTECKPKVHKIIKGGKLEEFDYDYFLKSDYSKVYDEIESFKNGGDKIEPGVLRNFIEKLYTPIFKNSIVPERIVNNCLGKCNTYNHNNFMDDSDIENFRNFAIGIFQELYNIEYKQ